MTFPSPSSAQAVVAVSGLSRRFGSSTALDDVSVFVPGGSVLGLVGENGAGKTTLIKHLLGMLKAQSGAVRVFGLDPVRDPVGVLSRVGYLSERRDLPGWMRVDEFIRYTRAFYPSWDEDYAKRLQEQFQLDPAQKIKTLSQGQQAKAGLLTSLAYRPDLLILDEPSSAWTPSFAGTFWRRSFAWWRKKVGPLCSRLTSWMKSNGWPTTSSCCSADA